jgi:signal peptidase I
LKELEPAETVREAQESFSEPSIETLTPLDSTATDSETRPARGRWRLLREIAETIVLTAVIFAVINFATGRFRIEGPSMQPNLSEGQYLIINKLVYRFGSPARGDIIVFHHPRNPGRDLIKRIIGLPGETVEIRQGDVYVDGTALMEPYVMNRGRYSVRYELGADEFFVLGDNRPNSDDSHNWGVLEESKIVGKAWISYWPPDNWGGVPHYGYPSSSIAQGQRVEERAVLGPSSE